MTDNSIHKISYKRTPIWSAERAEWVVLVELIDEENNQLVDYYYTPALTEDKKRIFNEILTCRNDPNF